MPKMSCRSAVPGLAVFALVAGIVSMPAAPAAAAEEKLDLVEHASSDAVVDTGESGDSAGDILTFANEIFDAQDANKLGTDSGYCVRIVAGKSWECFWTLVLAEGSVTVHGPFLDAGDSVLAVTGGTGKYAGVTGEMALHARNAEGSAFDFKYTLRY